MFGVTSPYFEILINVITNETLPGDDSKELLITSDSNNGFRRNYTRRPSPSRLTPYRPKHGDPRNRGDDSENKEQTTKSYVKGSVTKFDYKAYSDDAINIDDLGLFEEFTKDNTEQRKQNKEREKATLMGGAPYPTNEQDPKTSTEKLKPITKIDDDAHVAPLKITKLDKSNKYERVIDGAALLRVRKYFHS